MTDQPKESPGKGMPSTKEVLAEHEGLGKFSVIDGASPAGKTLLKALRVLAAVEEEGSEQLKLIGDRLAEGCPACGTPMVEIIETGELPRKLAALADGEKP